MLRADDLLPAAPRRVLVAGTSGSGKTTLAGSIGARLGLPHTEIDALFHGAGWTPRPSFAADVAALAAQDAWVTEWQYSEVRPLLAARADLLVWLDLPRAVVMGRVVRRTVRRRLLRQPLWNGNVEGPLHTFFTDPEHIVRWAWRTHGTWLGHVAGARTAHPDLVVVRLQRPSEVDHWLARLG